MVVAEREGGMRDAILIGMGFLVAMAIGSMGTAVDEGDAQKRGRHVGSAILWLGVFAACGIWAWK